MQWKNKLFRTILFLPFAWWTYQIFFGDLGAQPAQELNHQTGLMALIYFTVNLWLGALKSFVPKWPRAFIFLLQERRWLGVIQFIILIFHIGLYFVLEGFEPKAFTQIWTKTYLIFGTLGFSVLALLALTSNDFSVKKLKGKNWKKLHRLAYLAGFLVTVHIFLIEKADLILFAMITFPLWVAQIFRFFNSLRTTNRSPA